jgi:hypothetical protein
VKLLAQLKKRLLAVARGWKIPAGGTNAMAMWLEQTAWVWMPAAGALGALITWQMVRLGSQVRDLERRLNQLDARRNRANRSLRRVA